jgi:hypothetical protein
MDQTTTILLVIVVLTLTAVLALIGWQIIQILLEIRLMLKKTNSMMDHAANFTGNIGKSFQSLGGFGDGVKAVFGIMKHFKKRDEKEE